MQALKTLRTLLRVLIVAVVLLAPATSAVAGPYPPPSGGAGAEVSVSRVQAGGDVTFSGHGFRAHVELTIRDSESGTTSTFSLGAPGHLVVRPGSLGMSVGTRTFVLTSPSGNVIGTTHSDATGRFSVVVHFGASAQRGRHVLSATGVGADGHLLTVSATVFVTGVSQSGGGTGRHIPFTGFASAGVALGGILLVGTGSALLLVSERRHRRRRVRRVAA